MYAPNQTNSLYFHPHKLHFAPRAKAADSEQRNRWFPGYDASVALPRKRTLGAQETPFTKGECSLSDIDQADREVEPMDEDGCRCSEPETGEH
ncbi:hypothetical protein [Dyella sp. ASV21]|uniref:hypothetical protein n=1 Tax=Dyella sp. ASV21 TaxID=2795114 RepID=UPI0018EB4A95|nr:hypothetical protein [Dyella sp. ASV21]